MTRMDCYIKQLFLDRLQYSEFYMSEEEVSLLHKMIQEVYQNRTYVQLDVEQRVDVIVQKYRPTFHSISHA